MMDTVINFESFERFPTKGSAGNFLDAVTVWINKPQVANRRLSGTRILKIQIIDTSGEVDRIMHQEIVKPENQTNDLLEADLRANSKKFVVVWRELLPKQINKHPTLLEIIIYCHDLTTHSVTFFPKQYSYINPAEEKRDVRNEITYRWTFTVGEGDTNSIQLSCACNTDTLDPSLGHSHLTQQWLQNTLTPKLVCWTDEKQLNTTITSLRLVGIDHYSQLYATLKDKYGPDLVKNWTEKTDPKKFVYEDIAIATYLLLLWEEDRQRTGQEKKQSFVDLGCGNGLLVYILTMEGHQGLGIDLRRRKIWDTFPSDVQLQEKPIIPSADSLFPEFDWLIGNHSDELTPWIPVIAARSSFRCCYFVLPCCHHDFDRKFSHRVQGTSQYHTYLEFVSKVGQVCGFQVEEDTLRIPSTKRVCQIGRHRTYCLSEEAIIDKQRQDFIESRCAASYQPCQENKDDQGTGTALKRPHESEHEVHSIDAMNICTGSNSPAHTTPEWAENFEARSNTEPVRNCQRVAKTTKDKVVHLVFNAILAAGDATFATAYDGRCWRKGGTLNLSTVADMLDPALRQELKSECGGVQTLLRNHNHIFQVSGGKVQLRDFSIDCPWSDRAAKKMRKGNNNADRHKTSLCWFHDNHPDGCPRHADKCTFAHGKPELRPRTDS